MISRFMMWLIGKFCSHDWKILRAVELINPTDAIDRGLMQSLGISTQHLPSGRKYEQICTKCGEIRSKIV